MSNLVSHPDNKPILTRENVESLLGIIPTFQSLANFEKAVSYTTSVDSHVTEFVEDRFIEFEPGKDDAWCLGCGYATRVPVVYRKTVGRYVNRYGLDIQERGSRWEELKIG